MPSESKAEQAAMAIAEHNPSKLYKRNRGLLKMSYSQLHDFASTPTRHLPGHAGGHHHAKPSRGFGGKPMEP